MEVEVAGFSVWCAAFKVTYLFVFLLLDGISPATPDPFSPSLLLLTHVIYLK